MRTSTIAAGAYLAVLPGLLAGAIMLAIHGEYVKAPANSCRSVYTGAARDASYTTMQCFPSANGACGMQTPIYNQVTQREVRVVCDFTEWR